MPDPQPVRRFEADMNRIEREYLRLANAAYRDLRQELTDILLTAGVNDPSLPALFQREFRALARALAQIGRGQRAPVIQAVDKFVEGQVDSARQVVELPTMAQIRAALRDPERSLGLLDETSWLATITARLTAELLRLRAAGEELPAVIERLFAVEIKDRASVMRHGANTLVREVERNLWSAGVNLAGQHYEAGEQVSGRQWQKQAIAAIDDRTTDCCLRVHGQIVQREMPFHLVGTPRYSDYQQHSPFHDYCRTSVGLYFQEMETVGITTAEMRDASRAELTARQTTGRRERIWPANAISRRR